MSLAVRLTALALAVPAASAQSPVGLDHSDGSPGWPLVVGGTRIRDSAGHPRDVWRVDVLPQPRAT